MTRRYVQASAPVIRFCVKCGRELVCEVTRVRVPSDLECDPFTPYKVALVRPFCIYEKVHSEETKR